MPLLTLVKICRMFRSWEAYLLEQRALGCLTATMVGTQKTYRHM